MFICVSRIHRDFGKTLKRTVRKSAGLKPPKLSDRKQRYMLSGRGSMRGLSPTLVEEIDSRPGSVYDDDGDNWSSTLCHIANSSISELKLDSIYV